MCDNMEELKSEHLLQVLSDLKSLKKSGQLDKDEYFNYQYLKWRNLLEYSMLKSCIKHQCQIVRLETIALISESRKSTQAFTSAELDLILIFLEYNIGERLEFVPFIKKILRRANDSFIVLQRQLSKENMTLECQKKNCILHKSCVESSSLINERINRLNESIESYHSFFSSLKVFCLNNLYPGAVHCRKHSALKILLLMQDFLKKEITSELWNDCLAEQLVQCLFLDTYETNKEVTFKIIKCIQPSLMNLKNVGRVCEIIDTALELANSMRPIDTITASFMLKMVTLSPVIDHVLHNYIDPEDKYKHVKENALLKMVLILINRLQKPLELAKENIVLAFSKHSLYGYIFCIQSLLGTLDLRTVEDEKPWREAIDEIVFMCFELCDIVSGIVNNSSPEGHLPMDLNIQNIICENNSQALPVTSQMVLLCSWRSIKETSLLFGYLTSKCPMYIVESSPGLISEDQIIRIGEHFVTLLCETKHRGAFEQAYVGFEVMCKQLWRSNEASLKKLPLLWLHYLFLDISELKSGNLKLCATRRSAGVPFMVQAIMSSAPENNDYSEHSVFHSVMRILLGFAHLVDTEDWFSEIKSIMYSGTIFCQLKEMCDIWYTGDGITLKDMKNGSNLTEVKTHTLNILRALFKHSQLGDAVKEYISDGFKVAIRSYDGKSWAERNAATLLLGTLITRTFGVLRTKDHINLTVHNKMTGKIFFERYPDLLSLMLDKLENFIKEDNELINSNMQPMLLITSRLYPGNGSENGSNSSWKVEKFIEVISQCGTNRVYKTRELAARAFVSLSAEENIVEILQLLTKSIENSLSNPNALHGYMLQLHGIVNASHLSIPISEKEMSTFLLNTTCSTLQTLEIINMKPACFPAAICCINILSQLLEESSIRCAFNEELVNNIFNKIQMHLVDRKILKERPCRDVYETVAINFIIFSVINSSYADLLKNIKKNTIFWHSVLTHVNVNVQIISWKKLFCIIEKTKYHKLLHEAIFIALNARVDSIENTQVQDALYDFLYVSLSYIEEVNLGNDTSTKCVNDHDYNHHQVKSKEINQFCMLIGKMLNNHMQEQYFYERGYFVKLFCKTYVCSSKNSKNNPSIPMCTSDVYKLLISNSWMGSADLDCRVEVAKTLSDLYIESADLEKSCLILDWWTALLHLLLDDNLQVRQNASLVVRDIYSRNNLECHFSIMGMFFEKFFCSVGKQNPAAGLAALISWSITLMKVEETEMDDTDVFNRCTNYECFDPLWISNKCCEILHLIIKQYSVDEIIPEIVKCWLSLRLNEQLFKLTTFRQLIMNFKNHVPYLEGKLRDILDPTYNSKLIQQTAYNNLTKQIFQVS